MSITSIDEDFVLKNAVAITLILMLAPTVLVHLNQLVRADDQSELVVGTTDSVETSLDPANSYDLFGWQVIQSIGSPLVEYIPGASEATSDIVPSLATNWTTSFDGKRWTFTLRPGIMYDDGTEFNATHVKYTFDREIEIADPNGAFVGIGYSDIIENVTVDSKYQVTFNLRITFAPFLSLLSSPCCCIVDPHYAPKHGIDWNVADIVAYNSSATARQNNPLGLGPYILADWIRVGGRDQFMNLTANPNYWNASGGIPKTKNIIIAFYPTSSDLALAIQNGEIDVAYRQLSTTDINSMQSNANLRVWQGMGAFIQYMCFQESYWPFNETRIRQAVGAAINRTMLVNTVFLGQARELYTMIPDGMLYHKDVFQNLGDPNYTRTQELLAIYGFNATNKLTFNLYYEASGHYPQSEQIAQVMKYSIEASGVIAVNLQGLEWPSMGVARRTGTMEAFIYGWYPDYIDPDDYTQPFLQTSGGTWLNLNYSNPNMDQLIEWARTNTTGSIRSMLYGQIQDLAVADSPIIPIYQGREYAVTKLDVSAVNLDITGFIRYWEVVPEFQWGILLSAFMIILLSAVVIKKRPKARFKKRVNYGNLQETRLASMPLRARCVWMFAPRQSFSFFSRD